MKIILTKDVDDLGKAGDVLDVADGYARNYLVPRNMAVKASKGALQQAEAQVAARIERERRAREDADRMRQSLEGTKVVVAARAGDEGKLYGSITPSDIAEAIAKFSGHRIEARTIKTAGPIRAIGLHEVTVDLHPEVEFKVSLDVIPA
jgi:large subunit ribosomal protein L9